MPRMAAIVMKISRNGQISLPAAVRHRWNVDRVIVIETPARFGGASLRPERGRSDRGQVPPPRRADRRRGQSGGAKVRGEEGTPLITLDACALEAYLLGEAAGPAIAVAVLSAEQVVITAINVGEVFDHLLRIHHAPSVDEIWGRPHRTRSLRHRSRCRTCCGSCGAQVPALPPSSPCGEPRRLLCRRPRARSWLHVDLVGCRRPACCRPTKAGSGEPSSTPRAGFPTRRACRPSDERWFSPSRASRDGPRASSRRLNGRRRWSRRRFRWHHRRRGSRRTTPTPPLRRSRPRRW